MINFFITRAKDYPIGKLSFQYTSEITKYPYEEQFPIIAKIIQMDNYPIQAKAINSEKAGLDSDRALLVDTKKITREK